MCLASLHEILLQIGSDPTTSKVVSFEQVAGMTWWVTS